MLNYTSLHSIWIIAGKLCIFNISFTSSIVACSIVRKGGIVFWGFTAFVNYSKSTMLWNTEVQTQGRYLCNVLNDITNQTGIIWNQILCLGGGNQTENCRTSKDEHKICMCYWVVLFTEDSFPSLSVVITPTRPLRHCFMHIFCTC